MLWSGPHVPQPGWQHACPCLAFQLLSTLGGLQTESPGHWCLFSYICIYMQNLLGALTSSPGFHPLAWGLGSALSPGPGLACIHHDLQICPGT